jgi:hypothetical protein
VASASRRGCVREERDPFFYASAGFCLHEPHAVGSLYAEIYALLPQGDFPFPRADPADRRKASRMKGGFPQPIRQMAVYAHPLAAVPDKEQRSPRSTVPCGMHSHGGTGVEQLPQAPRVREMHISHAILNDDFGRKAIRAPQESARKQRLRKAPLDAHCSERV